MKIGLASYKFINNDIEFNLSQIEKALKISAKVDLMCFGETFLQGFDSLSWNFEADKDIAVPPCSECFDRLKKLSIDCNTDILLGYLERDGDSLYSSCAVIINGEIAFNYRRISKGWKEFSITDHHYKEGVSVDSFEYKGHNIKIALCGDMWDFPEQFVSDDLLIWPIYVNFSLEEWSQYKYEYAEQAYQACRNTLMVNSISNEPISHGGAFYFKNGTIESQTDFDCETVLIVDV